MRTRRRGGWRKRGSRWYPYINLGGKREDGPPQETELDCERWCAEAWAGFLKGELPAKRVDQEAPPGSIPFDALCGLYRIHKKPRWAAGTLRFFDEKVEKELIPHFGATPVSDITPLEVQSYFDQLQGREILSREGKVLRTISGVTVNMIRQTLTQLMRYAVRFYGLAKNPVEHVERAQEEPKQKQALKPHELKSFLEAAGEDRLFWELMAFTGMRQGEMFRMRWDWIDLQRKVILIRKPKRRAKGESGPQVLPLPSSAIPMLRALEPTDGYVFPGRKSRYSLQPDPSKMITCKDHSIKSTAARAGLNPKLVSMHVLRHTFITLLVTELQVSWGVVKTLARHSRGSGDVTFGYVTKNLDAQREAVEALVHLVHGAANIVPMGARKRA